MGAPVGYILKAEANMELREDNQGMKQISTSAPAPPATTIGMVKGAEGYAYLS